jgi:hypothetical protein
VRGVQLYVGWVDPSKRAIAGATELIAVGV